MSTESGAVRAREQRRLFPDLVPTEEQRAAFFARMESDPIAAALNSASASMKALRYVQGHKLTELGREALRDAERAVEEVMWLAAMGLIGSLAATPRAESERGPGDEWMDDPRTQGDRLNIALGLLAGFPRFRDARVLIAGVRDELWRSEAAPDFQHDGDHASLERISRGEAAPLDRELAGWLRVDASALRAPEVLARFPLFREIADDIERALAAGEAAAPQDTQEEGR